MKVSTEANATNVNQLHFSKKINTKRGSSENVQRTEIGCLTSKLRAENGMTNIPNKARKVRKRNIATEGATRKYLINPNTLGTAINVDSLNLQESIQCTSRMSQLEHLKWAWSELRLVVSVKCTPKFGDLGFLKSKILLILILFCSDNIWICC